MDNVLLQTTPDRAVTLATTPDVASGGQLVPSRIDEDRMIDDAMQLWRADRAGSNAEAREAALFHLSLVGGSRRTRAVSLQFQ